MNLRTITKDGEPWFVAIDVCAALEMDTTNIRRILDSDEVNLVQYTGLPNRGAIVINESSLYAVILKSRKPEAQAFKKWVTSVVLPAIRKDGAYVMGDEKVVTGEMSEDDLIAKAFFALQAKAKRLEAERVVHIEKLAEQQPAVEFVERYVESSGSSSLRDAAKAIGGFSYFQPETNQMNTAIADLSTSPLSMSSLQIAEYTGKANKDVIRDIRVMLDQLTEGDGADLLHVLETKDSRGCGGQVISDSLIGFFDVDSRSKALGDKLPSFECSLTLL